jgi:hypothetical protein
VTITINATISPTAVPGSTISNQGTINFDADGHGTNESSVSTDDPAVGGAADPTSVVLGGGVPPTAVTVPLLGLGAKVLIAAFLAGLGLLFLSRRRRASR